MKKLVLASVSALALLSVAACSDSTDTTQTQSVPETQTTEPAPATPPPADTGSRRPSLPRLSKQAVQSDEESRFRPAFFIACRSRR